METVRLSYRELAERLGVKPESARKMAQRKRWRRDVANDGTARVHVPLEALPVPGDIPPDVPGDVTPDVPVAVLEAQIAALREIVEAERRRADAAEIDRDRWHDLAVRPWWKRLAG